MAWDYIANALATHTYTALPCCEALPVLPHGTLPELLNAAKIRACLDGEFELAVVIRDLKPQGGIAAVIGQWPGDETDEEIKAAQEGE